MQLHRIITSKVQLFFCSISILFSILVSSSIIPSLLPTPNIIAITILLISGGIIIVRYPVTYRAYFFLEIPLVYIALIMSLIIYYLSELVLPLFYHDPNISRLIPLVFLFALLFGLHTFISIYGYVSVLRIYVLFCTYMAIAGIVAILLYKFNLVDTNAWSFNLTEATSGKIPRDVDKDLYVFPYYLGILFIGERGFSLLGFDIIRACGLCIEPHYAGLLLSPSLFLTNIAFSDNSNIRKISTFCISIFLVLTGSVTSYLIIAGIIVVIGVKKMRLKHALGLVVLVTAVFIYYKGYQQISILENDLIYNKLKYLENDLSLGPLALITKLTNVDTLVGKGLLMSSGFEKIEIGFLSYLLFFLVLFFAVLSCLKLYFSSSPYGAVGLSVLYIIIHMLRGVGPQIMTWPFFIFFTLMLGYSFDRRNVTPGERKTIKRYI